MKVKSQPDLADMLTAEFWAKNFAQNEINAPFTPIQNFEFNMLKARILLASAQEISNVWPNINRRIIKDEKMDKPSDLVSLINAFLRTFEIGLASYYIFTEQALVSSVSASEVYFKDSLAYTIQHDKRILKRYLDKEIRVKRIVETGLDLSNNIGKLIVENMNFQNLDNIQKEYDKIFNFKPFTTKELNELKKIFAIRHLIVHRAGIVDHMFLSETGMDYEIGNRICLERNEILQMITFIHKIVIKTESKIKSQFKKGGK